MGARVKKDGDSCNGLLTMCWLGLLKDLLHDGLMRQREVLLLCMACNEL